MINQKFGEIKSLLVNGNIVDVIEPNADPGVKPIRGVIVVESDMLYFCHNDEIRFRGSVPGVMPTGYKYGWNLGGTGCSDDREFWDICILAPEKEETPCKKDYREATPIPMDVLRDPVIRDPEPTNGDPWAHRSSGLRCSTCMWFCLKKRNIGRCRRHAPTMNGYPVVYITDWCGDHKVDEDKAPEVTA
jgi:hypothetical protein